MTDNSYPKLNIHFFNSKQVWMIFW